MSRAMLLARTAAGCRRHSGDLRVTGLVQDSRACEPGDAFVAIAGFGAHGLRFVDQARAAGAAAILFEPPAPRRHARAGRCDRGAGPARAHGRDGRPFPRPAVAAR